MDRRSPLLGSLTVIVAASLFGMLGTLSRVVYGLGMEPFGFVAWRAGIGAVVTAGFAAWGLRRGGRLVSLSSLDGRGRAALATATLAGAMLNMAMFLAFQRVPIAVVLLCFYLYPALVVAGAAILGWERLDRVRMAALGIALAGMVAVVGGGGSTSGAAGPLDLGGVALALSAAVSQAVFVLVSRHGYRAVPTDQAMALILAVSATLAGVAALVAGAGEELVLPLAGGSLLGLMVFGGVFAAAIPSFLFLAGIRWIGPVRAGILMLVEPLVGALLAAVVLAEGLGPIQVAGGLAILAAAAIIQRAHPAEPALLPAAEPEPEPDLELESAAARNATTASPVGGSAEQIAETLP